MAAGKHWSHEEVQQTVADYMTMLMFELTHQPYNKTEHRRALMTRLAGRSDGSIELKHQNISAVLNELRLFWIPGYKPRSNYQQLLAEEVSLWIATHPDFDRAAQAAAEAPAAVPTHIDFAHFEVPKPELSRAAVAEHQAPYGALRDRPTRDYVGREARNSSLGRAGEILALRFERDRLARAGCDRLADKVLHVAEKDDGAGFDILSFEPNGRERFIEVKTTCFAKETPFFASSNEVRFARSNAKQFHLYRVFEFRKAPRCFVLSGPMHEHCALDPTTYRCSFR
jgi:hypothetical protein